MVELQIVVGVGSKPHLGLAMRLVTKPEKVMVRILLNQPSPPLGKVRKDTVLDS